MYLEWLLKAIIAYKGLLSFITWKQIILCKLLVLDRNTLNHTIVSKLFVLRLGGARGVMVIVAGNGHGDTSSNPGRDGLQFT